MTEQEPMIQCPKGCGTSLPLSQMHDHYETCLGKPINPLSIVPIWPTSQSPIPTAPVPLPPIAVDQPKAIKEEKIIPSFCKKCGSKFIENAFYRVCAKCETIKPKSRMWWWIIFRYMMMAGWIFMAVGFILGIYSYHSVVHP